MKEDVRVNFASLFPYLADKDKSYFEKFRKVHRVLLRTAPALLRKEFKEVSVFDLVDAKGHLRKDLITAVHRHYDKVSTRSSQESILGALVEAELEEVNADTNIHPGAARCDLINPEKLPQHIRQIWEVLPRQWPGQWQIIPKEKRPLVEGGREYFELIIELDRNCQASNVVSLLKENHESLSDLIRTRVRHELRRKVFWVAYYVRWRLGIKLRESKISLEVEQLPAKLAGNFQTFLTRAKLGFAAYPDLKALASTNRNLKLGPLAPSTIYNYTAAFLYGLGHMSLSDDIGIEDLLRLQPRVISIEGGDTTEGLFNPFIDEYHSCQNSQEKPGIKEAGFDSGIFKLFLQAVCCIGRFNGHFTLADRFSDVYKGKIDYVSRKTRKLLKKKRWTREWIDAEILRLKERFDRVVKKRSYLTNDDDLVLVLYLPQLVVLRFLGFRQQCLRRCSVGKNIIFGRDGYVTFHYDRHEIKNDVPIHQTLSMGEHDGLEEIVTLLDVLQKYYYQVLKVIRSQSPIAFRDNVGDAFFTSPAASSRRGLIVRYPAEDETQSYEQRVRAQKAGVSEFHQWFTHATYRLIDFSAFKDFKEHFHPHFLRGVCCDWMRKVLHWSWEEIEQAMGDREATLKTAYYDEGKRMQDASGSFGRSSRERKEDKEEARRVASSVPVELYNATQQSLVLTTDRLHEETARRAGLEKEVKELREARDFLLSRAGISPDTLPALIGSG